MFDGNGGRLGHLSTSSTVLRLELICVRVFVSVAIASDFKTSIRAEFKEIKMKLRVEDEVRSP